MEKHQITNLKDYQPYRSVILEQKILNAIKKPQPKLDLYVGMIMFWNHYIFFTMKNACQKLSNLVIKGTARLSKLARSVMLINFLLILYYCRAP